MTSRAPAIVAVDGVENAGAVVYWRLSGGLDPVELATRWVDADLSEKLLPATPTPVLALGRAMRTLKERRLLVRPLETRSERALVRERAVVRNGTNPVRDLTYSEELRAKLSPVGGIEVEPADHPKAEALRSAYSNALATLSPHDVGGWLVDVVRAWDGVALRDSGGVYYLPPSGAGLWQRARGAIGLASSHVLHTIPALKTADAVAALLDSISAEAASEAEALAEDIGATDDAGALPGPRALRTRLARCGAVEAKVARYEALLGGGLDAMRERLDSLRAMLSAAILTAEAAAAAERAAS